MDYASLHDRFLLDRRKKEKDLIESGNYYETHHIIPKSIGGDNKRRNLIALTPEDHYFIHMVLAKMIGGKMIYAFKAMSIHAPSRKLRPDFTHRIKYGHLRRMMNENGSSASDQKKYKFKHLDGREVFAKRLDIRKLTGLNTNAISNLITGSKKTYNGWFFIGKNPYGKTKKDFLRDCFASQEFLTLYHYDGREWVGRLCDFKDQFKKQLYFQSDDGHCFGWYRDKETADSHYERVSNFARIRGAKSGSKKGINNRMSDKTIYKFVNTITGEEIECTRCALAEKISTKPLRLNDIVSGRRKTFKGWSIVRG